MPGHKGSTDTGFLGEVLKYDVTETDGLDNLHDAQGVILESERYAAGLYGSGTTHFLVGGSTAGILSAIAGVTKPGDELLMGRNCHRSVYNAVELNRLHSIYLYPDYVEECGICGMIHAADVEEALLEHPDIKAVVITSPTYEGICSDISAIADTVHRHGRILIVDAAHGAHFGFCDKFPQSAVRQDADIVIHSVHKTLPAPTQTALIHIRNDLAEREAVERMLRIYQTSSPSYLLMAGIDNCMSIIGDRGKELFDGFYRRLCTAEKELGQLKRLKHIGRKLLKDKYGIFDADPGKLVISAKGSDITGMELYDMLRNGFGIQPEMAADTYCLLIMTVMDSEEGFERVKNALICIDEKISSDPGARRKTMDRTAESPASGRLYTCGTRQEMPVYVAVNEKRCTVGIDEAAGMISADYVSLYPPGIPLLIPGEEITELYSAGIEEAVRMGLTVQGLTNDRKIRVIDRNS